MRSRTVVLALCCAIYILGMFHRSSPGVLADDLMAGFGTDAAGFGLLGGSAMLALGLLQLPSGVLSDAWGSRRVIFGLTVLAGLGTLWFGLSSSWSSAMLARFMVGMGIAVSVPIFALLAETFPSESYGRAVSVVTASGALGTMLAAPPLVFLNQLWGWRAALLLFAGVTLGAALLFRLGAGRDAARVRTPRPDGGRPGLKAMGAGVLDVLRTRAFWPLCLWQLCMMGSFFMLLSLWWVPYLTRTGGCTPMQASAILLTVSVAVIVLQPGMAWLSDVRLKARRAPLIAVTILSFAASLAMVFLTGRMSYALLTAQALLFSAAVLASPLLFAMVRESFPPRLMGTALGCVNMLYPVWTALLQYLFGLVVQSRLEQGEAAAYASASVILAVNVGLALAAALCMKESFGASPQPESAVPEPPGTARAD